MSITKTFLDGEPSAVAAFLTSTGLFGSVTQSTNTITCKDTDNNTLLTITKDASYTWSFAVNVGEHTFTKQYENTGFNYGYNCNNGAFLVLNYNSQDNKYSIVLSKTNTNHVAIIIPDSYDNRNKLYCLAYSDTWPISYYTIAPSVSEQTVLSPFITNAATGTSSYTPKAFYIPYGEYVGRGYAKFIMNGTDYVTDGYFAISDAVSN